MMQIHKCEPSLNKICPMWGSADVTEEEGRGFALPGFLLGSTTVVWDHLQCLAVGALEDCPL